MIVAVTGHRPNKLPEGYNGKHLQIRQVLREHLDKLEVESLYTGMALGFDQIACEVALGKGLHITACIPCLGQDSAWPRHSQIIYHNLISKIEAAGGDIILVTEGEYTPNCMIVRDHYMVDNADLLIALWNGTDGGTYRTVEYAKEKKVTVDNIWGESLGIKKVSK